MDKFDELLLNEKYEEVEAEVKSLLEVDKGNSRLWYILFLSQNSNYINIDFDNLKNELAFNKAIENSTVREEMTYKIEYELYKNLSPFVGFDRLFRYYQAGRFNECFNVIENLLQNEYKPHEINKKRLFEAVDYFFEKRQSIVQVNLQLIISNILYILTNDEKYLNLINILKESDLYFNSLLKPYNLKNKFSEISSILIYDVVLNNLKDSKSIDYINLNQQAIDYYNGYNCKCDYKKAFELFYTAAKNGNVDAQKNLGNCYLYGHGTEKNYVEAYNWYLLAANAGYNKAQNNLANCYYLGQGVEKNFREAFKWYKLAADQGSKAAQNNLGDCYYYGRGVTQNLTEAFKWFKLAAAQGSKTALKNLAYCHENGKGTERNTRLAKYYLDLYTKE